MKDAFALIGLLFTIAAVLGAVVPGMNFHVYFGGDKAVQKMHASKASQMLERLQGESRE